jgi:polyisoprenoid-binding protein YceI
MAMGSGRFQLSPDNAQLLLRTGREGLGSRAGHDLTIEVTDWSGQVDMPESGPADASVSARLQLGSLTVREGTGGARPLTDKDRRDIAENARRTLDVDRHPTATFESQQVVAGADGGTIRGILTLHGTAAPVEVRVSMLAPDRYRARAVVKQSAYGIKPYSAFLGALKVRDDVEVEIDVGLALSVPSG